MNLDEFLGVEREGATTHVTIGEELHGAFGGAFGGVVAASMLVAARAVAPGRRPFALDCRFLRGLPAGRATARATVVHEGRSITAVDVALTGPDGKLAATAAATFANREALFALDVHEHEAAPAVKLSPATVYYDTATMLTSPAGVDAPILSSLAPRIAVPGPRVYATVLRVPWDDDGTGPESSCLAADMCTGAPVLAGMGSHRVPHPNPDLSVRFLHDDWVPEVAGIARLESVAAGAAAVRFDIRCGEQLLAVGQATSLLLDPTPRSTP